MYPDLYEIFLLLTCQSIISPPFELLKLGPNFFERKGRTYYLNNFKEMRQSKF
jgi:hypothetical protein